MKLGRVAWKLRCLFGVLTAIQNNCRNHASQLLQTNETGQQGAFSVFATNVARIVDCFKQRSSPNFL